jgi:hypothetical protein
MEEMGMLNGRDGDAQWKRWGCLVEFNGDAQWNIIPNFTCK